MSQDVLAATQQHNGATEDTVGVANDAHLIVFIGQTCSTDEVKLILTQLNAALNQIGKPVQEHIADIVNSVRHKQFEKSNYDQQQRVGFSNDVNFSFELFVNPLAKSVRQSLTRLLTSERKHKFLVNLSGDRANQGDLDCHDAVFTCDDLLVMLASSDAFGDEQRKALKSAKCVTLLMPSKVIESNRAWRNALEKQYAAISVQPINVAASVNENSDLNDAITHMLNQTPIEQLLQTSKHTGTLKLTRPALYIFPSQQGDSAYFALNGYSMLINGGYDRQQPCFWKFINMLQQIDSVLVTHADLDALGGLTTFFAKKASSADVQPNVLAVLGNLIHHQKHGDATHAAPKSDVDSILNAVEKLKIKHIPLVKNHENLLLPFNKSQNVHNKYEHINLYSKLGHGSLDLYVLSPYVNSPEYKEFYHQQQQQFARQTANSASMQKSHLAVHGVYRQLPLSHLASSVCLLVWMPAPLPKSATAAPSQDNNALRLLFTGNAPQHVVLNALDKIKDFELLSEPVYRVKPEVSSPSYSHPIASSSQPMRKQVSASSGVGSGAQEKPAASMSNCKLNTSISSKPVAGTANGHHIEPTTEAKSSSSKPPVPTQSVSKQSQQSKSQQQQQHTDALSRPAKSTSLNSSSLTAPTASSSAKHEEAKQAAAAKKPPQSSASSASQTAAKKKSITNEPHVDDKEKEAKKEAGIEKKKPAVPKRDSSLSSSSNTANGVPAKQSQSETATASTAKPGENAPTRSSLSSHNVASSKSDTKTESTKPPVPKQQHASTSAAAKSSTKPVATSDKTPQEKKDDKHEKKSTDAAAAKKSGAANKPAPAAPKKASTGGQKSLTISMSNDKGAATTAPVASDEKAPDVASNVQQPSSVESIEIAMQAPPEAAAAVAAVVASEPHESHVASSISNGVDVVVEQVEEQIEKIEQVVNVEHVVEEIVAQSVAQPSASTEHLEEQPHHETPPHLNQPVDQVQDDQESANNHFAAHHESPNLSPVKKDFAVLNQSCHHQENGCNGEAGDSTINNHGHEDAPVVEEQLTSEVVTTAEIEIVSGNLNGDQPGDEAAIDLLKRPNDDVMTRSFIEDETNPASNPFADTAASATNEANGNALAHQNGNGNSLNESCDLNRTHELFDGDESSSSLVTGPSTQSHTNGNGNGANEETNGNGNLLGDLIEDKLIIGLESLKLANQLADNNSQQQADNGGEPRTWNLLELPTPVHPTSPDNVVDVTNVDLTHTASEKVENENVKPDVISSPAAAAADAKKQSSLPNGKSTAAAKTRQSVDSKTIATQSTTTKQASSTRQGPMHAAYVELSYIPAHGNEHYVDADFFRRVRARHYVLSALEPSEHVLNALCEAKEHTWEDKQLQVTLIPTYESEALRNWFTQNEERLMRLKIDITPAAQHATITMDDKPELNCQVYKLEF